MPKENQGDHGDREQRRLTGGVTVTPSSMDDNESAPFTGLSCALREEMYAKVPVHSRH